MTKRRPQIACPSYGRIIVRQSKSITETIDGATYKFDSTECALIFKKLGAVYVNHPLR